MAADSDRFADSPGLSSWRRPFDFRLKNGLRVLFARREKSSIVDLRLVLEGGFAADPNKRIGLAALATAMFSEGRISVGGTQLGSGLDALGALTHYQVAPDGALIGISALNANFGEALRLYANALSNVEFKIDDLELVRANRLALIAAERLDPFQLALRVLPPMVYGRGHVYARPFTGSGIERDIAAITCDDLRSYYSSYLVPKSTTLVVAGACETTDLHHMLEQTFGQWHVVGTSAVPMVAIQTAKDDPSVVIVNRPGAAPAVLAAALPTFPRDSSRVEPLMVLDTIVGGIFTSRLNLSLRERKGWTYGVRSSLLDARLQGLWLIRTAVRADCTVQAIAEINSELENLAGGRPSSPDEFCRAVDYLVARIPASRETCGQMANALAHVIVHRLPLSYLSDLASRLRQLTPKDVTETCRQILAEPGIKWMVVGDPAEVAGRLQDAGFDKIKVVEPDGAELP